MYERQVGWLEAREKNTLSTTTLLRSKDEIDHTFQPKLISKTSRGTHASTPKVLHRGYHQKKSGLVAHDVHARRYARARGGRNPSFRQNDNLEALFVVQLLTYFFIPDIP
jgi:hypothetical protein